MSTEPSRSAQVQTTSNPADGDRDRLLRQAEERLRRSVSLLQATLDSTTDGFLVVDRGGRIVAHNRRFLEIWGIPEQVIGSGSDEQAIEFVLQQLEDPDGFVERIQALYLDPVQTAFDIIRLRDGRVLERYSRPQRVGQDVVGRVWTFRDVTEQKRMQEALLASERRYRRLFEESRHALYISTRDGDFVDINRAMLELFGYDRTELLRLNAAALYAEARDRERFQREAEARGSVRNYEVRLRSKDDRVLDCLVTATARRGPDGAIIGYEGIIEDITERKRSTEALRRSEEYFRSLIENALDTITILAGDGRILYESPSVERVLGFAPEEMVGKNVFEFIHSDDVAGVKEVFRRGEGRPGMTASLEFRFRHRDGSWRMMEAVGKNLLHDPSVGGVVVNARDVTQRREAEERLVHDAFHDRLTGLPNRALFMDRLGQLVKRSRRADTPGFTVLFLDVDRFKTINDSLGHSVGDRLLMEIGARLEGCLRPGDTVARVGGDEFTLLLDGTNTISEATAVADRVHEVMARPFSIDSRDVHATVSIGIAPSADGYDRAEEILRDADIAMYRGKIEGRARSEVFDRTMHDEAVARLELETSLHAAVAEQQFELHYQPVISLRTGRVQGFEALLRWRHPSRGLLLPIEFLDMAEDTGLIVPIGWWALEEAARRARDWWDPEAGGPYVAANLSATQLSQPDLIERMGEILDRTGAPPGSVRVELTESVVMERAEVTVRTMERLRRLGVPLMIDDFGTGYSSLSYLHRFAAHTLKIDGSFIEGMGPGGENSEIVRTIVALADELGVEVVAEGIESADHLRMARILGCGSGQGFFVARPALAAEAAAVRNEVWELP